MLPLRPDKKVEVDEQVGAEFRVVWSALPVVLNKLRNKTNDYRLLATMMTTAKLTFSGLQEGIPFFVNGI